MSYGKAGLGFGVSDALMQFGETLARTSYQKRYEREQAEKEQAALERQALMDQRYSDGIARQDQQTRNSLLMNPAVSAQPQNIPFVMPNGIVQGVQPPSRELNVGNEALYFDPTYNKRMNDSRQMMADDRAAQERSRLQREAQAQAQALFEQGGGSETFGDFNPDLPGSYYGQGAQADLAQRLAGTGGGTNQWISPGQVQVDSQGNPTGVVAGGGAGANSFSDLTANEREVVAKISETDELLNRFEQVMFGIDDDADPENDTGFAERNGLSRFAAGIGVGTGAAEEQLSRFNNLKSQLIFGIKDIGGLGVLSKDDIELALNMFGDPTSVREMMRDPNYFRASLEEFRGMVDRGVRAKEQVLGIQIPRGGSRSQNTGPQNVPQPQAGPSILDQWDEEISR